MIDLIITLAILIPIIASVAIYVTEYRECTRLKKEIEDEWSKYSNASLDGTDRDGTPIQLFSKEE